MAVTVQDYETKKVLYTSMAGMMTDIAAMGDAGWSLVFVGISSLTVTYKKDVTIG